MKEWKGNADAARAAIGAKKRGSNTEREPDDFYATDPVALQKLLDGCSKWLDAIFSDAQRRGVWECACGNGNLAKLLEDRLFDVHATDLKDRGYGIPGIDFLQSKISGYPIILTNPPYSLATEFAEHALEILLEGGVYIALMNITYFAGQKRYQKLYSKLALREIYVFSKLIECLKNNTPSGHSSIANYAWFVFQKGYSGQPTLYWL